MFTINRIHAIFQQWGLRYDIFQKPLLTPSFIQNYFFDQPNRAKHILGVVFSAKPEFLKEIAYLHDIGYSNKIIKFTGFHPIDGAFFAYEHGYSPETILAILYHTQARGEAQFSSSLQLFYEKTDTLVTPPIQKLIDGITYWDLRVSPLGKEISPEERLNEILNRYPPKHPVHQNILKHTSYFLNLPFP